MLGVVIGLKFCANESLLDVEEVAAKGSPLGFRDVAGSGKDVEGFCRPEVGRGEMLDGIK